MNRNRCSRIDGNVVSLAPVLMRLADKEKHTFTFQRHTETSLRGVSACFLPVRLLRCCGAGARSPTRATRVMVEPRLRVRLIADMRYYRELTGLLPQSPATQQIAEIRMRQEGS